MKFKITITKEVIDKSLMCGTYRSSCQIQSCAFSEAYNQLVPVSVDHDKISFLNTMYTVKPTRKQVRFIKKFDKLSSKYMQRYSLVGQTFDVEIPDEVIEYWYGDASKAAQKIIDNPIMQVVC